MKFSNYIKKVWGTGGSSGKCLVWFDRAVYEKLFKFNTILHDTDVYVTANVIFAGWKPTLPQRDVVSSWQAAHRHSGFGWRRKQIRFLSSLLVALLSSTVSSFEIWMENSVAIRHGGLLSAVTNMSNPNANSHVCLRGKGSILAMLAVCDALRLHTVCSDWLWWDLQGNSAFMQLYLLLKESAAVQVLRDFLSCSQSKR